ANTFFATAEAIWIAGATAVLVDCDPLTKCIDPVRAEAAVTSRTRAIIPVHMAGEPCDLEAIYPIAAKHGIPVIEDAAEMHGQTYRGRPCGSFGNISTFSFYPNKHITTGEGGMIDTDDDDLAAACRSLRNLCFQPNKRFVHERLGWNLRMTNLQAAIGLAQLERLDAFVARKRRMGAMYTELLKDLSGIQLPLPRTDYAENIYWVYGLMIDEAKGLDAEEAMRRLAGKGVGCRPFFYPMHQQPVLQRLGLFEGETYPVAERMCRQGFYIPSGMALTDEQLRRVAEAVQVVLG
ncbi:MAG: DegT/DnrJ/EryC1/StrS family aminotransferase, partial [Syntrophus sp. (in: bacteria)]